MDDKDKIVAKLQFFGFVHGQLTQGRGKTMDAFFSLIPTLTTTTNSTGAKLIRRAHIKIETQSTL
jgi:hypothetical protein